MFGHHPSYDSLTRSKEQGCVICEVFGPMNDIDDVNLGLEAFGYYSVFTIDLPRRSSPAMIVYSGEVLEQFAHDLVIYDGKCYTAAIARDIRSILTEIIADDFLNAAITHSTSDAVTWSLVQEWLGECIKTHRSCSSQAIENFTPTRLLELDTSGPEQVFRLIDGYSIGLTEPYMTLSHCWGSGSAKEKLRLLTTNDCILRNGLPVSSLPRLFRDVFEILERLGGRCIWIDRLCIIQDSTEDWESEAATMQTVYQNGFLNIAALGARDDQDGCFFERNPRLVAPTIIDLSPPNTGPSSSLLSPSTSPPLLYRFEAEDESWRSAFAGEPLLGRAWVLQERILAARNLYFGRRQVFWECGEASRCETVPRGRDLVRPSLPRIPRAPKSEDGEPVRSTWKSLIDGPRDSGSGWHSVVRRYCECSLTFPTDKLVALSGLAKHMSGSLLQERDGKGGSDAYLAGHWRDTMPQSLLWETKTPGIRPYLYRAPSWSWASVDGDIEFASSRPNWTWFPHIISARTIPRGRDATGELAGGHITLSTPLCIAKGIKIGKACYNEREYYRVKSLHHPDTGKGLEIDYHSSCVHFDTSNHYEEVAVILFSWERFVQSSSMVARGLAITPIDKIHSCFRRVGLVIFSAVIPDEGDNPCNDVWSQIPVKTIEMV